MKVTRLSRDEAWLHVSSFSGDGVSGGVVSASTTLISLRIVYQLLGTSLWVITRTTPDTFSASLVSTERTFA